MSDTVMAARNMLSALRAEQAAKFLDEVEGAALKADAKANLKAAKQRMMVAVKADVDEGLLAKFLEGKGATDKTVQAFGAELKMVRKAQAAVKKGKPKGMPVTAAGAREPGVRAKGPIGHIPLTKKIMEDEVLGYMADLRTAGYLVDLDQVAKAYARVHGMDNRQVEYLAGQIATARYGGGPKSVSLQDEIRDLLGKKHRHVVGDDGKLVRAKDDRFTEFYEGILNGETPNSGRAWAEAISLWEKEAYDKRIESVRTYTGNAYRSINNAERKSKGKRAWKKKVRDDIDSLMDEVPRPKQWVEVYRGTTSAQFETTSLRGVKIEDPYEWVGEEFIEYGYMSTSVESKSAFGGQIRMHLELPPDAKGMYVSYGRGGGGTAISKYAHENELILARQTCFKVVKVEPRGNGYEVWAKVTEQRV